ncbi:Undecaprenyl-phosphate galactosephosphotransferase [Chitinispirillum alkaliphilum]|nr:Undecaprenyl-phosphate galactosephosphotransferase [Chitinispirillum alkaliphilum]
MKYIKKKLKQEFYILNDLIVLGSVFLLSAYSQSIFTLECVSQLFMIRIPVRTLLFGVILFAGWHFAFRITGAYNFYGFKNGFSEVKAIVKGSLLALVLLIINVNIFQISIGNTTVYYKFGIFGLLSITLSRYIFRISILRMKSKHQKSRNLLIAGTGKRAQRHASFIEQNPESVYNFLGFVDNEPCETRVRPDLEKKIVCSLNSFSAYLRENVIDEIFICLPIKTYYNEISDLISSAEEQGVIVKLCTEFFDVRLSSTRIDYFNTEPVMTLYTGFFDHPDLIVKKMIDFLGALVLLIITSPIFLISMLLIWATSGKPIFFLQDRLGENKRIFKVVKFRTMVCNAEEKIREIEMLNERKGEAAFKIKNDPRVTSLGKVLRKLSIDELPQLINVLKGEMSLVGPRPLPIRDYKGFSSDWHRRRFSVKPGITCIWQVSGRDNIPFEKWMEMDMEYIDKWSLWLDVKLLFKTIPVALFGSGAS